jgi:hypothetical protein
MSLQNRLQYLILNINLFNLSFHHPKLSYLLASNYVYDVSGGKKNYFLFIFVKSYKQVAVVINYHLNQP